jgi:putative chitinase
MTFKFKFEEKMTIDLLRGNSEADDWHDAMHEVLPLWDIDTVNRVAGFISQCSHESVNFGKLSENMNYSADRLNVIFAKYFKRAGRNAAAYHRRPRSIANVVYADRMGNGNAASNDGWNFRGGGLLHLTGRNNYTAFGKAVRMSPENAASYVRTKKGAVDSACWFWDENNLNKFCDSGDIRQLSKTINGGWNGLAERIENWDHAIAVLSGNVVASYQTVRVGSRGVTVRAIQEELEITADGVFGPGTEAHLKAWQKSAGLVADGIAGPNTLEKLLG